MKNMTKFPWGKLLLWEGITFAAAGIGALLGGMSSDSYQALIRPPLSPPALVFPIVWSILYLLMGYAAFRIAISDDITRDRALGWYLAQLAVNMFWQLFFFRLEWRLFAFFWILLLIVLVSFTMAAFRRVDKIAFRLLIPYFIWLLFAAYLNLGTYLLNR